MATRSDRSHEELLATARAFLATDIFNISADTCATFLDPLIESWNIDLATFGMEIVLNRRLAPGHLTTIEFVERESSSNGEPEPGLQSFLEDSSLSER